jgi:hypothetical protein
MPRRRPGGPDHGALVWSKPTDQAVHVILSNPVYAGASAHGRRRRDDGAPGRAPRRRFALDALDVLLPDHHPGYVGWDRYLADRAPLRDNARRFATSRGAPRPGEALLQGIVVCGRCGCRMQVHHSPSSPSYVCRTRKKRYGEPVCRSLSIAHADAAVGAAFLAVIRPAEIAAPLAPGDELDRARVRVERQWRLRLERARYAAERARRQDDLCEPENRLVARELEGRWNARLRALAELEEEYRRARRRGLSPLTEEEKVLLRSLVGDVPALWRAAETTAEDRKRLVRCLVREVVLTRDAGAKGAGGVTAVGIGWKSGAWTALSARRPTTGDRMRTPAAALARIRAGAAAMTDERRAAALNAAGLTTRMGLPWTAARVQRVRTDQRIPTGCPVMPRVDRPRGDGLVPARTAAARPGVVPTALAHRRRWGFVRAEQRGPGSPLWIRLTPEDVARLDGAMAARGHGRWPLRAARGWPQ